MDTKEKIKVLIIENNRSALGVLESLFKKDERYELISKRVSARDSTEMEKTRAAQKNEIMEQLKPIDYQILILDLLLRDKTETEPESVGEDLSGCENILSLEVANELKVERGFESVMLVFTSSSGACHTHDKFEKMRSTYPELVPQGSFFLFKPEDEEQEVETTACPVYREDNVGECGKKGGKKACSCTRGECFLAVLDKYYTDFWRDKGYAE